MKPQELSPSLLYEQDETAWLEATAELIRLGRLDEIDYPNLAEYLADMARRDRREVESRLAVFLTHALKWAHQPDRRSGNRRGTATEQGQEVEGLGSREALRVKPDGRIMNGNTRIKVLEERGFDVDGLPREVVN